MKIKAEEDEEDLTRKKRWSVTYTKHIRQKRKVYQDGFLDLHLSTNKVALFDDSEKLLECKVLEDEELIGLNPGETLSFNSYLVDLGDPAETPCGYDRKPVLDSKGTERPKLIRRQKFRSPTVTFANDGNKNDGPEKENFAPAKTLSPSRRIIREFRKSEAQRYGANRVDGSMDAVKPSALEWQVLYTTQVTQKAKKYHDGLLRLAACGTLGRQVMLYDSRKLLTTRFLKKDEMIRCGESISFDGYLVEIGEQLEDHKPLGENLQNHRDGFGKMETTNVQQNCPKSSISVGDEWQVMYTTQVTQKAKRYYDGFLRLATCASQRRQIMLYDAGRRILDSRFLKKDETIKSGESIAFDSHLVDIGEAKQENHPPVDLGARGHNGTFVGKAGAMNAHQNLFKANKSGVKGDLQEDVNMTQATNSRSISSVNKFNISNIISAQKPLRDATQILSILQKPICWENAAVGCTGKDMMPHPSSSRGIQYSDSERDHDEICELFLPTEITKTMGMEKMANLDFSQEKTASVGCRLSNGSEAGKSDQESVDGGIKWCNGDFGSHAPSSASVCPHLIPNVDKDDRSTRTSLKSSYEMDEWPTFDLGF